MQVEEALGQVQSSTTHSQCTAALHALLVLTASQQGLAALASCNWQGGLSLLLSATPATMEDQVVWCGMLALVSGGPGGLVWDAGAG